MSRPTNAFVLAAGLGTRMRPLTEKVPKPLVKLAGRTLIDHALDRLAAAGIERAVVNVHYLADQIEAHLATRETPRITISHERAKVLDTGGGVAKALPLLGSQPFVVHNSDSVWLEGPVANIPALMNTWDGERMDALLLVAAAVNSLGYEGSGDFVMDGNGRIGRRQASRPAPFVFTGVSIMHPRLFDGFDADVFSLNAPWDRAIAAGRLYGMRMDGFWMHVGTPQALADAERAIREGEAGSE